MKQSYEEISKRAFEIWEKEGQPEGRELDHWLKAEQELEEEKPNRSQQRKSAARQNKS